MLKLKFNRGKLQGANRRGVLPVTFPKIVDPVKFMTNGRMKPLGIGFRFRSDLDNRSKGNDGVQDYLLK